MIENTIAKYLLSFSVLYTQLGHMLVLDCGWKELALKIKIVTAYCYFFPHLHLILLSIYRINTFLIRHGWSEVRPVHLHPFICLCSNGNKCVGGINTSIFLKLAGEQFVPNSNVFTGKKSNFQGPDWILQLCGGESHAFIWE